MKAETRDFLDHAAEDIREAEIIATAGLAKVAARSAYYAVFHAAEALIFQYSGKIAKTHSGVRSEFSRIWLTILHLDNWYTTFFAQTYSFKEISDYGSVRDKSVTMEIAEDAIAGAKKFVAAVTDKVAALS